MAGLILSQFRTNFPEFNAVADSICQALIDVVNNGFNLISDNVTDTAILNIYYYLVAHFVAVSTTTTGTIAPAAGSYMPESSTVGAVSASFAKINDLSADQSFMLSTRYGQVYWFLAKQQYIKSNYLSFSYFC